MPEKDYKEINKKVWNKRTDVHVDSEFYANESFVKGRNSLNSIELELLGDLTGKSVLHLQCHFGQDTISLTRLGAEATGVDLSGNATNIAKELAIETGSSATFVCCDIYDLPKYLNEEYDIVFTSYGTIGWLPDIDKWAAIVNRYLKPGGRFVFVEFHPVVWMFDDDFDNVKYSYFNASPIIETNEGTYADDDGSLRQECVSWNHGVGEVVTSLLAKGLVLNSFTEYDYSPYDCFNKTVEVAPGKFRIKHLEDKLPMLYAVVATKGG